MTNAIPMDWSPESWPTEAPTKGLLRVNVAMNPVSKSAQHLRGKPLTDYEKAVRELFGALMPKPNATSRFGLRCVFYRSNRQRIDCDNLVKMISDLATGRVWRDDSQVIEMCSRLFIAAENPRVEIAIYEVPDSSPQPPKCAGCDKPVRFFYKSVTTRFCSTQCRALASYVDSVCPWCKRTFRIRKSALRGGRLPCCSRSCADKLWGAHRTAKSRSPTWKCRVCGGPTSSSRHTRCKACGLAARSPTGNYWTGRVIPS